MLKLYVNGIIVQMKKEEKYQGVEGDNWYFNYIDNKGEFQKYFDEKIEVFLHDENYVDCCNDMDYIVRYIKESKKRNITYRLLLCETVKQKPQFQENVKSKILGFDYAYAGGSYYSCINNDIHANRISEFKDILLNEYGLFDTEDEILQFIELRNNLKYKYPKETFEEGEFIIYRLREIYNL